MTSSLVGSEMCIRDRSNLLPTGTVTVTALFHACLPRQVIAPARRPGQLPRESLLHHPHQ
eukprot:608990-Prorocentrum_lima.AAC.1